MRVFLLTMVAAAALATTARAAPDRAAGDFNREMDALAAAHPGFVAARAAPYRSTDGRPVRSLEITNAADGKPVLSVVNPDGWARGTRTGADLNRDYPLGWVRSAERGAGPGSEPKVRDTTAIVQTHRWSTS
jgi:hypothetical protein